MYNRNLKKVLALMVIIVITATFSTPAITVEADMTDGQICASLGILVGEGNGVTTGYLAKSSTRLQAAIMFLRLKGLEAAARTYKGTTNFADLGLVGWAEGRTIMAYLKNHPELGWIGDDINFSPLGAITAQAYYKVMLEALGYKSGIDFDYKKTIEFAKSLGLSKVATVSPFKNSDIATATVEGLKSTGKDGRTLAAALVDAGVIKKAVAVLAGIITAAPIRLYGSVKDRKGNPITSGIWAIDKKGTPLCNILTDTDGTYEVMVPWSESISVTATPQGISQHFIKMEGEYRVSKYFELTHTIVPTGDSVDASFAISPAAAILMSAYSPEGDRLNFDEFNTHINPPGYFGYDNVYGTFPMSSFSCPVPTGPSIGMFKAASHPEKDHSQWQPCFTIPPGESVYIMMLWEVPGIGTFPLRADNKGKGYNLNDGQVLPINLVYEFAETEYRRAFELKSGYESQGYQFSTETLDLLSQASDDLNKARSQTDVKSRALLSYEVLRLSIMAKEQMTMEVADKGIAARKDEFTVIVKDEDGKPVSNAKVTYNQNDLDFVLGYGGGEDSNPFPYASYKAGIEMGYKYNYGIIRWSKVCPQKGVYDFSAFDSAFNQWRSMGYDNINACIAWLGTDNVPVWAQSLEFSEYRKQLSEFVRKAVEHFEGTIKYLNLVVEISLQTVTGSRYVTVDFESDYLTGVQPTELIELIRTVFQAAREVHSSMLFGYYGVTDYNNNVLNPLYYGAWPCSYSFLKSVLDSGVRPDYIGVETFPGTSNVPLDLSTVTAIIQAYHDLSGLPVLITETISYPSRAEDYGDKGPAPNVYWHEGMTQSAQAEWETSFFKLAMGLPYVLGVHMGHTMPDYFENAPWSSNGTDCITLDYKPKKVYYAVKDLFDSWRTMGSAATGTNGKVSFTGLNGTYSIGVTTAQGLFQNFEIHLDTESKIVTVSLDRAEAIKELQQLVTDSQKRLDWSKKVGRTLDYNSLNSKLNEAQSALVKGDYGKARLLAEAILASTSFNIDGNPDDWKGIKPIATLPKGENGTGAKLISSGIDLKALYSMRDDKYLYMMVEVYDPPISLQPGGAIGGDIYPQFLFDMKMVMKTKNIKNYHIRTYLPYGGQMDVYDLTKPDAKIVATLYSINYGKVLEFKVPLALLDNPTSISTSSFVMTVKEGKSKPEKWFDGYFQVLGP